MGLFRLFPATCECERAFWSACETWPHTQPSHSQRVPADCENACAKGLWTPPRWTLSPRLQRPTTAHLLSGSLRKNQRDRLRRRGQTREATTAKLQAVAPVVRLGSGLAPLWRIWRGCAATRDGVEAPHGPSYGGVACSLLTALACLRGVRQQWLDGSRRPHRGLEHRGAAPPSTAQATSGSLVGLWRRSDDDASVDSTATSGGGAYGQYGSKRRRPRLGDGC